MADLAMIEDVRLPDASENEHRLGDLWREHLVIVAWLRHYG